MKSRTLFDYSSPLNFLFLSIKVFSFPCWGGTCTWLTMVEDLELQFSAELECHSAFLSNPSVWRRVFLLDQSSCHLCIWSSPGFFGDLFKCFVFLVKALFYVLVLVWYFSLILKSDCCNQSWLKCLRPTSTGKGLLLWNCAVFSAFGLFLWKDCPLEYDWKKPLACLHWDQSVFLGLARIGLQAVWVKALVLWAV